MTTPQDFAELEGRIAQDYPTLSRRLQQTARFLLDHPQEVAFATVAKLAEQADVTPSTLIRFANSFGFKGFSEMQQLFRGRLMNELPNYAERIRAVRTAIGETPGSTQLLWEFADANREVLEDLPGRIASDDLDRALNLLEQAEAVHVMGARRSFVVASYLTYALHHIEKRTFLINGQGGMYREQIRSIGNRDVLLLVSFSPYAQESQDAAADAKARGIPLVVITDTSLSPLTRLADVALIVHEAEVKSFRGLTASLCLTQTLAIALGMRQDQDQGQETSPTSSSGS